MSARVESAAEVVAALAHSQIAPSPLFPEATAYARQRELGRLLQILDEHSLFGYVLIRRGSVHDEYRVSTRDQDGDHINRGRTLGLALYRAACRVTGSRDESCEGDW